MEAHHREANKQKNYQTKLKLSQARHISKLAYQALGHRGAAI